MSNRKNIKVSVKKISLDKTKPNNRRVAIFVGGFSGGGAERVACNLANYLFDHGFNVDAIGLSEAPNEYFLASGVRKVYLIKRSERTNKIHDLTFAWSHLKEYVVTNQDTACYVALLPLMAFMLVCLKKYTNSKMVISERNAPASYGLFNKLMMKYAAKRCDGLVVQTKTIGNWYKKVKNKVVIPNAINKDISFPRRCKIEKKIVAVGRFEKQKNYPMLIKGFYLFNKQKPDYSLEIFGKGELEADIKKLVSEYGLSKKVTMRGFSTNISEQISDAACFVMTSNYEGMSNALIEAMCIGLPCVVTDCDGGGARALIKNGKNGILVKKNDIVEFSHGLDKVVSNPDFAKKISRSAMLTKEKLSYETIYGKWMEFINKIVLTENN